MKYTTNIKVSYNGEVYNPGEEIEMSQKEAKNLINLGVLTKLEKEQKIEKEQKKE
ncbi:DUF7210 family protein [Thermospira aquatica]|uniref:DUF7210 domain-containing protein n=1 Tax=Thermospira aquatica TaxID=2828656 RepID=A0AAX3BDX1_9SPIR|nr:hypothetical protein [Thermospira aquatica]URA10529.1 hypothetical protein KDW03_01630 [Thermospira aquatica]